jgi:hypothetical protein
MMSKDEMYPWTRIHCNGKTRSIKSINIIDAPFKEYLKRKDNSD